MICLFKCFFVALGIPIVIALRRWVEKTNKPAEHPLADSKN